MFMAFIPFLDPAGFREKVWSCWTIAIRETRPCWFQEIWWQTTMIFFLLLWKSRVFSYELYSSGVLFPLGVLSLLSSALTDPYINHLILILTQNPIGQKSIYSRFWMISKSCGVGSPSEWWRKCSVSGKGEAACSIPRLERSPLFATPSDDQLVNDWQLGNWQSNRPPPWQIFFSLPRIRRAKKGPGSEPKRPSLRLVPRAYRFSLLGRAGRSAR